MNNSDSFASTLWSLAISGGSDESVWDGSMVLYGFELNTKIADMSGYNPNPGHYLVIWQSGDGSIQYDTMSYRQLAECEDGFDVEVPTRDYFVPVDEYDDLGGEAGY